MAWTDPAGHHWTTGEVVTAANMETYIRLCLEETAPDKVTTAGDLVQATGANALARLGIGTALQELRTNAGVTAVEWASIHKVALKTGGQDWNTDQAVDNVTDLVLTLPASTSWLFEAFVSYRAHVDADIRIDFAGLAGATVLWGLHGLHTTAAAANGDLYAGVQSALGSALLAGGAGVAITVGLFIRGTIIVDVTPGDLQMRAAQGASHASDTTIHANSWLMAHRV